MLTENGKLPDGVEFNGSVCRDFELREQLVRDAVELFESEHAARAQASDVFYGICITARRLTIAGVPREEITPDFIMGMTQDDFNELAAADKRMKEKRRTFRGAAEAATEAAYSAA